MSTSIFELQREIVLRTLKDTGSDGHDDWKVLVCDRDSRVLLNNVAREDEVLNCHITDIEHLEKTRESQPTTQVIYLLTPSPHIVDWLKADLYCKRYGRAHVIWTSKLRRDLASSIDQAEAARKRIYGLRSLNIDYFPRESHLISFQDPWSFQVLFNPRCDSLIRQHLDGLTQKIVSLCVSLGEYPLVRYYRPPNSGYDASVLCSHLARFVQDGLDEYARNSNNTFPPQSPRPRALLLVTDRSMDLMSPLVHELTYQAMVMDLLPTQEDADRIFYRNVIRRGQPDQEEKDVELNEKDKIWVENRHLHMKDLLIKLSDDFRKFQAKNPQFAESSGQNISVNTIKDMLAGLPEFQEGKEAFSLHIDMAEKCAKLFQDQKLLDITSLEQSLATGLDEDNQRPKNITDQLVRLLGDETVTPDNRARLLMMYIIYRGGILEGDIRKLQAHGELPDIYTHMIYNLQNLGARIARRLGDNSNQYQPSFPAKEVVYAQGEEVSLSRFEPQLRYALEGMSQGTLDNIKFPPVKPHLDDSQGQGNVAQTSLRSASKPTWASNRPSANKPRQRLIVFMAGGATYAESRACYEVSQQMGKEVFLATTHMLTPKVYLREVSLLNEPRKALGMPVDGRGPEVPKWLNEPPPESMRPQQPGPNPGPVPPKSGPQPSVRPPTKAMGNMDLGPPGPPDLSSRPGSNTTAGSFSSNLEHGSGKLKKDKDKKDKKTFGGLLRRH